MIEIQPLPKAYALDVITKSSVEHLERVYHAMDNIIPTCTMLFVVELTVSKHMGDFMRYVNIPQCVYMPVTMMIIDNVVQMYRFDSITGQFIQSEDHIRKNALDDDGREFSILNFGKGSIFEDFWGGILRRRQFMSSADLPTRESLIDSICMANIYLMNIQLITVVLHTLYALYADKTGQYVGFLEEFSKAHMLYDSVPKITGHFNNKQSSATPYTPDDIIDDLNTSFAKSIKKVYPKGLHGANVLDTIKIKSEYAIIV